MVAFLILQGARLADAAEIAQDTITELDGLPARQRQIMAWTLSGFTPAEIAPELGLTPRRGPGRFKQGRSCEHVTE